MDIVKTFYMNDVAEIREREKRWKANGIPTKWEDNKLYVMVPGSGTFAYAVPEMIHCPGKINPERCRECTICQIACHHCKGKAHTKLEEYEQLSFL